MIEDAELLRRYAQEKSEEAFAELARRRIGLVYSVALRHTHDVQRAEDVTQKVFTALAQKAGSLSQRPVLIGWLHRSAQFAASDAVRAERRRRQREQEAQLMQQITNDTPEPDWEKMHPVLDEVLNTMDERDRDAVLLRFYDAQPFAEIGRKLQLTENAARMRVERALDKMQAALARRGMTSTAAALGVALANQAGAAAPAGLEVSVASSALLGAGVSTAATAAIFMSTTKTITVLAGVIAVLAVSTAIYEVREKRQTERARGALIKDRDALQARVADLGNRLAVAEQQRTPAPTNPRENNGPAFDEQRYQQELARQRKAEATALANAQTQFVFSPEIQDLAAKRLQSGLTLHYGPLYSALNLPHDKIQKFETIMMQRFWAVADVLAAARSKGASFADPAVTELESQTLDGMNGELETVLGGEGYSRFRHYEGTAAAGGFVETLAGNIYHTSTPLTATQAAKLSEIIATSASKPLASPDEWLKAQVFFADKPNGALGWNDIDWDAALKQAKSVLAPAQIAALQALWAQAQGQQQFQQKYKQFSDGVRRQISESKK